MQLGCAATIGVASQAAISKRTELAKAVVLGSTETEIVSLLGAPQKVFRNKDTGVSLLFYCDFGFSKDQFYGYWLHQEYGNYDRFVYTDYDLSVGTFSVAGIKENVSSSAQFNCYHDVEIDWASAPLAPKAPLGYTRTLYNIDMLRVTTYSKDDPNCSSGSKHKMIVEGLISPDSSFAMSRLLERLQPCRDSSGNIAEPITVSMKSGGGLLKHGYLLGQALRQYSARAVVENESTCASSCAVAFLGGKIRSVEEGGQVMFHAPYFNGKNEYGKRDVNCNVGEEALDELKHYYITMTDSETGKRLFDRTMWYYSAEDGWVVTGGAAAELYGIATQR